MLGLVAALCLGACAGPEQVVLAAADAARSGDTHAFQACFTPRSRPMLRAVWRATGDATTRGTLLGAGHVEIEGVEITAGRFPWEGRRVVRVREGERTMLLVLHGITGSWRIDLIDTERALTSAGGGF